jgi:predicted GTPase
LSYFPGRINLIMADVVVINKVDTAAPQAVSALRDNVRRVNPSAVVVDAASPIFLEGGERIWDRRVLVVEDGPTLTHGEMKFGAGVIAAKKYGAAEIVDSRAYTSGKIRKTYETYPEIGSVLPAVGYGDQQIKDLEATINNVPCDLVVIATPVDLTRIISINKPMLKVGYELQEIGKPDLRELLKKQLNL